VRRQDIGKYAGLGAKPAHNRRLRIANGGSCIGGPDGEWILPPAGSDEALLVATLDHRRGVLQETAKLRADWPLFTPGVTRLMGTANGNPTDTVGWTPTSLPLFPNVAAGHWNCESPCSCGVLLPPTHDFAHKCGKRSNESLFHAETGPVPSPQPHLPLPLSCDATEIISISPCGSNESGRPGVGPALSFPCPRSLPLFGNYHVLAGGLLCSVPVCQRTGQLRSWWSARRVGSSGVFCFVI